MDKPALKTDVSEILDGLFEETVAVSLDVWKFAELGLEEEKSARAHARFLADKGFRVTEGAGGLRTALIAEWGHGKPVIGFLGEYDALPGLSQAVSTEQSPLVQGGPGHGCGHNLLGAGAVAAAVALKEYLAKRGGEGTVRYYGCPAEETLIGKVFMATDGVFSDLDAAITWHPGDINTVAMGSSNAVNSARFVFHGRTAHAAGDPHNGRSALDAVELMNVGANYLREHVIPDARIHYVITDGGGQPNVVPARAEVWYYVRAPRRNQVEEVYARLLDVAKGAALMTGTAFDVVFLSGCYDVLPNETLGQAAMAWLRQVGAPAFDERDMEFARKIAATVEPRQKEQYLERVNAPQELYEQVMNTTVVEPLDKGKVLPASTDVGDVSWITPTLQVYTACWPIGVPGHSWQVTACSGHPLGQKGMLVASKVMALTAVDLVEKPELLAQAREEFVRRTKGREYKSPLPEGLAAPVSPLR